ncbi:MAG: hypothetical protein ACK463_09740 [Bradyrhizobium sp.]|jgi:hypothetical protein|uniref:hypothetical protein n=1 Tax=Bradyrhizobium TaxID=374 RepID=UPI000949CFEA|nr:hypothetical protein [Bradyrhizobium viridifuturi]
MIPLFRNGLAWIAGVLFVATGFAAHAEDQFKRLDEKQIRARLVGNDITDGPHWSMHFRPDGKLISSESGNSWTGTWNIRSNKLCLSLPSSTSINCNEVWVSGANVRMRASKDQETFDAIIKKHQGR